MVLAQGRVSHRPGRKRLVNATYDVCNLAVSLELFPSKLPGLGTSRRVLDASRGADDSPVERQNSSSLEELDTSDQ